MTSGVPPRAKWQAAFTKTLLVGKATWSSSNFIVSSKASCGMPSKSKLKIPLSAPMKN